MHHAHFSPLTPDAARAALWFTNTHGTDSGPPGHTPWQDTGQDTILRGKHVLVVEDEATVAVDLEYALIDRGAKVIGPVGTLAETLALIEATNRISAAILDVRVSGDDVYPAARLLNKREVPFLFHTGHAGEGEVAALFPTAAVCVKPQRTDDILDTLGRFFVR